MHQSAEIYLPRKKKVHDGFHSNTFRIFDESLPERLQPDKVYKDHKYATRALEESELLNTHNIPQPYNAKFIRTNVRFLNAPVVHMETDNTKDEQFKWWATESVNSERPKARYCEDTTQRADYQPTAPTPVTRAKEERARAFTTAIIPTVDPIGQPKTLLEHMSFTHQYDSRRPHNQPYQGGRHGTFVWTDISKPSTGLQPLTPVAPVDRKNEAPPSQHISLPFSTSSSSSSHPTSCQARDSSRGTGRVERGPVGRAEAAGSGRGGEAVEGSKL